MSENIEETINITDPKAYAEMMESGAALLYKIDVIREELKDYIKSIAETFGMKPKDVRKVMKTVFKRDYDVQQEENSKFEALYETYQANKSGNGEV